MSVLCLYNRMSVLASKPLMRSDIYSLLNTRNISIQFYRRLFYFVSFTDVSGRGWYLQNKYIYIYDTTRSFVTFIHLFIFFCLYSSQGQGLTLCTFLRTHVNVHTYIYEGLRKEGLFASADYSDIRPDYIFIYCVLLDYLNWRLVPQFVRISFSSFLEPQAYKLMHEERQIHA